MAIRASTITLLLLVSSVAAGETREPNLQPTIEFIRLSRVNGTPQAEFRLVNPTAGLIYYRGLAKNEPVYHIQHAIGSAWEDAGPSWCMGSGKQQLEPSSSVYFVVSLAEVIGAIRVRMDVELRETGHSALVLSPRVNIPARFTLPEEDEPLVICCDIEAPRLSHRVEPKYPEVAQRAHMEGLVALELVVDRLGNVRQVRVTRSTPVFDQAAVNAVQQWKYRPARRKNGRTVSVYLPVYVKFELPDSGAGAG